LAGKPEGKRYLEDIAVDGRKILKWIGRYIYFRIAAKCGLL
jgi:hypothetical protein